MLIGVKAHRGPRRVADFEERFGFVDAVGPGGDRRAQLAFGDVFLVRERSEHGLEPVARHHLGDAALAKPRDADLAANVAEH
jgi:hypothetical protein